MNDGPFNPYAPPKAGGRKYFGKYKGFVRRNNDPEGRSRIRCFCPGVMGPTDADSHWLGWADGNFPWLGGIHTAEMGPPFTKDEQVEAEGKEYFGVWLEFEDGNPDHPIWCGTFMIARTDEDADQLGTSGGDSVPGGGVLGNPTLPDDVEAGPLDPIKAEITNEIRLRAPKNRDIVLVVEGGGAMLLGPSGAHITGIQLTLNGKHIFATVGDYTGAVG